MGTFKKLELPGAISFRQWWVHQTLTKTAIPLSYILVIQLLTANQASKCKNKIIQRSFLNFQTLETAQINNSKGKL
jgi:hypothetical protein